LDHIDEVYHENYKTMLCVAHKMLGNGYDANDIAQDVFIDFFEKCQSVTPVKYPKSWLYRVTLNKCADWLRKNKRHKSIMGQMLCFDKDGKLIKTLHLDYAAKQIIPLPGKKLALVGWVLWQSSVREFVAQSSFNAEGYDLEIKPSKMVFHDGHIYALIVKNAAQGVPLRVVRFHLE